MTRVEKIRASLKEKGIDALIVLDELNQHYLSGFAFTDGMLLITMEKAFLMGLSAGSASAFSDNLATGDEVRAILNSL